MTHIKKRVTMSLKKSLKLHLSVAHERLRYSFIFQESVAGYTGKKVKTSYFLQVLI